MHWSSSTRSLMFTALIFFGCISRCTSGFLGPYPSLPNPQPRTFVAFRPYQLHTVESGALRSTVTSDVVRQQQPTYAALELGKYALATGTQYALLVGALALVDKWFPAPLVGLLFAFLSLRSRIFSLLDNSRPDRDAQEGKATPKDVKRPSWTPPGVAFPIIWLSITVLRAVSASLVYSETGSLISPPLRAFLLHLCVGDTWNTITNVEKRLGVSALASSLVWASVVNAVIAFKFVSNNACNILAPSAVWITIACLLSTNIWLLNDPKSRPLWPSPGDGQSAALRLSNFLQIQANSIGGRSKPPTSTNRISES